MIKLVATDIDGTLLIPEGQFTDGVKQCVQKLCQKGIKVVLVTGRMNAAASLIAEDLGLDTPVVSYQGGLIKQNSKTLYERCLTCEQTEKIIEWAKRENIHLNLYNDDVLYSEQNVMRLKDIAAIFILSTGLSSFVISGRTKSINFLRLIMIILQK